MVRQADEKVSLVFKEENQKKLNFTYNLQLQIYSTSGFKYFDDNLHITNDV